MKNHQSKVEDNLNLQISELKIKQSESLDKIKSEFPNFASDMMRDSIQQIIPKFFQSTDTQKSSLLNSTLGIIAELASNEVRKGKNKSLLGRIASIGFDILSSKFIR